MRKLCAFLMLAVMLFTMTACGENDSVEYQEESTVEQSAADTEAAAEETPKEIESLEETEAEEADLLTLEQVTPEHLTQKTLPQEGAWLKETDQVSLVAAIEEKDIYLYCLNNGHPWGGEGVILQCGEAFWTYPVACMIKYRYPVFESCDPDGDGTQELLFATGRCGGTGLYLEDLYVFEPDGEGYSCIALENEQISALINEQVSFELLEDGSLQAFCRDGSQTNMGATRNTQIFRDQISYDYADGVLTLRSSVQVIEEDGQWKYLCDYLDVPAVNKDICASAEYIHTIEADVVYDGETFAFADLHFVESERVT